MTNRTVLITGCSSGFGKLAVNTFRAEGWNVVATMRSPEKEAELTGLQGVLVTRLDVKDPQSIDAAFEQGAAAFGSIDAVVNNAGYGSNALFEQSPDASVRDIYETNVFGLMNVMRRALAWLPRTSMYKGSTGHSSRVIEASLEPVQARSNRSRFITLAHAATKSRTRASCASSQA